MIISYARFLLSEDVKYVIVHDTPTELGQEFSNPDTVASQLEKRETASWLPLE